MRFHRHAPFTAALAGVALFGLAGPFARGQAQPPAATPSSPPPAASPAAPTTPPCSPCPTPGMPYYPELGTGGVGGTGEGMAGTEPAASSFNQPTAGAGFGSTAVVSNVNYIDSAIPQTMFRLRYNSFGRDNRPDRADFFYPKCGCFRNPGPDQDPNAPGPPLLETKVNAQQLNEYLEFAPSERLSGFVEIPERYIFPERNVNASGLGDVNFGFKYAMLYSPDMVLTAQLRTFAPTGDPFKGLGTNNWVLEPALLFYRRLSDRLQVETELRDIIPVASADDFAGNVVRYGVGVSYLAYNSQSFRVWPVVEVVGWTVLNGKELDPTQGVRSAGGNTIVNGKVGFRLGFGNVTEPGMLSKSDIGVSYGHALTGTVWYKEIFQVEYRLRF